MEQFLQLLKDRGALIVAIMNLLKKLTFLVICLLDFVIIAF